MSEIICDVCPHGCHLKEGQTGKCRVRKNENGKNVCAAYGRITAMAMDPVEKKPLRGFYPGSRILSVGSYGCNLSCPFCQNSSISMTNENTCAWKYFSPEELCAIALQEKDNLGLAFTYNEMSLSYEYIIACAKILKPYGKKIVLVTNGCVSESVWKELLPYVDALNTDLKGDRQFYQELGGDFETVKKGIELCYDRCHLEVTTLLVPGKNDSDAFMEWESSWLASLDENIVLHLSRYFPRYHYEIPPTDVERMKHLRQIALKHLKHVYLGNV